MKTTFPFLLIVKVPFPLITTVSFSTLSAGSTSLRLVTVAFVTPAGSVNVGVPSWGSPWIFIDVLSFGVTFNGFTLGVYLADAVSPFASVAWTEIPAAGPVNPGFGTNVTSPVVGSIRYVPSFGTTTSFPSTGVFPVGFNSLYPAIETSVLEIVNDGLPVWVTPCNADEVASVLDIVTSVTVGV